MKQTEADTEEYLGKMEPGCEVGTDLIAYAVKSRRRISRGLLSV
jgi:hypothetical protein